MCHSMFLAPIEHLHDHNYCIEQDKNNITDYIIDQQYADDIGLISSNKNIIDKAIKKYCSHFKRKKLDYK